MSRQIAITKSVTLLVLCFTIFILGLYGKRMAQAGVDANLQDLSGSWTGTVSIAERGTCALLGTNPHPVSLVIDVDSSGDFTAVASAPSSEKILSQQWSGHIYSDMTVTLRETQEVKCRGKKRSHEIRYQGKIRKEDGEFIMEFEGENWLCPQGDCVFRNTYKLVRLIDGTVR